MNLEEATMKVLEGKELETDEEFAKRIINLYIPHDDYNEYHEKDGKIIIHNIYEDEEDDLVYDN